MALIERGEEALLPVLAEWAGDKLADFQRPLAWYPLLTVLSDGGIKRSRKA